MDPDRTGRSNRPISLRDLDQAPMEEEHKKLVISRWKQLVELLAQKDERAIGTYTNKQAAREQLARMDVVIQDYENMESSSPIESMATDVLEASFSVAGIQSGFSTFVNPALWGREQQVAETMQAHSAGSIDDVIELWNIVPIRNSKVVPDISSVVDIGSEVDWNNVLFRSRSEDDLLHHRHDFIIEDQEVWDRALMNRQLEELDLAWSPVFLDPQPNVGRQRRRTSTAASSRRPSLSRMQRKRTIAKEPCLESEEKPETAPRY